MNFLIQPGTSGPKTWSRKVLPMLMKSFLFLMISGFTGLNAKETYETSDKVVPQQDLEITGTVTDASGMPLPGATIMEKGTNNGTQTDFDGNYALTLRNADATLVVSYMGFSSQEIVVDGRSEIDIVLQEDAAALEEVVVVGYGTQKKSDVTGAVASADLETFREQGNTSIVQSLQGTVAGLNVGASTEAGEDLNISIRGNNSLGGGANTSPLIVVDGIIYRGSLQDINPDDVRSIDVLKDASSTAIYGSQASNGVILVTTRSGAVTGTGKPTFNFSSRYSIREDANRLEYGSAEDYLEQWRAFDWELAYPESPDYDPTYDPVNRLDPNERLGLENGTNVDWQDLLTQQSFLRNHNLSLAGNNEFINYFVSGSYLDEAGVIRGDDYSKITGRINLEMTLTDWLKIGTNSFVTTADHSGRELNRSGYTFAPIVAPYDENGDIVVQPTARGINPLLAERDLDKDKRLHLNSTLYTIIDIPWIEGLSYRMNYNNSYRTRRHNQFLYSNVEEQSQGRKDFFVQNDWTLDNILSYTTAINEVHNIDATLVYGREERYIESTEAYGTDFSNELLGFNNLTLADLEFIQSAAEDESSIYQMARLNYNYDSKYFLTGTVRRDGFSGFGAENKFAVFPSVAAAWRISNEDFFRSESISDLRIRASYGESGKRGLDRYTTLAQIAQSDAYVFGDGGNTVPGQEQITIASPDLKWETTRGINLGLDLGFFNNRITGNIEYYNNNTEDIIVNIQIPSVNGFTNTNVNLGKVHNTGLEFSINSTNIIKKDFSWSTTLNFSTNKNEVVSVLGKDDNGDGIEDDIIETDGARIGAGQYGFFIGESLGTIYHFQIDPDNPLYQIGDEIPGGYEAGFYRLVDQNGDGTITSTDDKVILGKQEPAYRFSILNSFKYKNFGLDIFINSIQGGKNGYLGTDNWWNVSQWDFGGRGQVTGLFPTIIDYWSPANPNSEGPSVRYGGETKPAEATFLRDRSFVRLQNVNLSYSLEPQLTDRLGIKDLTLNLSGNNLITWTSWKGLDPETNTGITRDRPVLRSYTFGVNLSF